MVRKHNFPTLALPNHSRDGAKEKPTGIGLVSQLTCTLQIVPSDLDRILYEDRRWFIHNLKTPKKSLIRMLVIIL